MRFQAKSITDFVDIDFDVVIDVRSPSEFAEDHVPGSVNLPVLDDAERARVGTIYVQQSAFLARKIGAALVARNAAAHIEGPLAQHDGGWRPLVYCWRGGQRSGSFSAILSEIGWRVETLDGGYRTWRHLVKESLYDRNLAARLVLLDGNTGTAKTDLLTRLSERDVQVIDLEGLANHRGSALGAMGIQPSQKAFESALALAIAKADPTRPIVVEAESSKIGRINLPPRFFSAMKSAPRLEIEAGILDRAKFLVEDYGDVIANQESIEARLDKLVRLQGHARVEDWKQLAKAGDFERLATELIEQHYDRRYSKVRSRVGGERLGVFHAESLTVAGRDRLADQLAEKISAL